MQTSSRSRRLCRQRAFRLYAYACGESPGGACGRAFALQHSSPTRRYIETIEEIIQELQMLDHSDCKDNTSFWCYTKSKEAVPCQGRCGTLQRG